MGRVVMDTSTLVGAMLRSESKPRNALLAVVKSHVLCVSQSTLTELHVVLQRSKFDRYAPLQTRLEFLDVVRQTAHLYEIDTASEAASLSACRDPKDDKFLSLCLHFAISSDMLYPRSLASGRDLCSRCRLLTHNADLWHQSLPCRPLSLLWQQ